MVALPRAFVQGRRMRAARAVRALKADFDGLGITDFGSAEAYVRALPYGRVATFDRVLADGRGTCSTKHACLVAVAPSFGVAAELVLAGFEMSEANTPGAGRALAAAGLTSVLELHCLMRVEGALRDVTGLGPGVERPEYLWMTPLPLADLDSKPARHRAALAKWLRASQIDLSLEDAWRVREACIADLAAAGRLA